MLRDDLCPECDRPTIDGRTHDKCRSIYGLGGVTSVFRYEGVIKRAIKLLKYRFVSDIAQFLIEAIPQSKNVFRSYCPPDIYVYPIPLQRDRLRWRGFNQAELLAKIFAGKINLPIAHELLARHKQRIPQADIASRKDRIANAKGIFIKGSESVPKSLILFDDVWTTGATIKEATKVLKRNGATFIWAVTLAR